MNDVQWQHEIDARGLRCPEPVMLLHARVRRMVAGEVVKVVATDPSTTRDIAKFCRHLGHELVAEESRDGEFLFLVRKGTPAAR